MLCDKKTIMLYVVCVRAGPDTHNIFFGGGRPPTNRGPPTKFFTSKIQLLLNYLTIDN